MITETKDAEINQDRQKHPEKYTTNKISIKVNIRQQTPFAPLIPVLQTKPKLNLSGIHVPKKDFTSLCLPLTKVILNTTQFNV